MPIENVGTSCAGKLNGSILLSYFQDRGILNQDYIGHLDYRSPPEEVQMPARILPKSPSFKPVQFPASSFL